MMQDDSIMEEDTVKNKFFTGKFVLTPKFAGNVRMEDNYERKENDKSKCI